MLTPKCIILTSGESTLTVRKTWAGDDTKIVDLLQKGFKGWPKLSLTVDPIDYWRWKYADNPMGPKCSDVVLDGSTIVGCDHGIPHRIILHGESHLSAIRADLTVLPEYRKRGVWTMLKEVELPEELGYGLARMMSGNPIIIKSFQGVRPQFPKPLINYVIINDIEKHLNYMPMDNQWMVKTGFRAARLLNKIGYSFESKNGKDGLEIREVSSFGDEVEEFWSRVEKDYDFIVERRREYLNWRYLDPRAGEFKVFEAFRGEELQGYIAIAVNRYIPDYPVGYITDLLTVDSGVSEGLIQRAMDEFSREEINLVNYLNVQGHPHFGLLGKYGFLDSMVKIYMFYETNSLKEGMDQLSSSKPGRLHFTWGDHDSLPLSSTRS